MSLILEALKKSEAERQLGRAPGLMTPMSAKRRRRGPSPWWGIGALAVFIAAGAAWLVTRDDAAKVAGTAPPTSTPVIAEPAPVASETASTAPVLSETQPASAVPPATAPIAANPPEQPLPAPSAALMPSDPEFPSVERESLPVSPSATPAPPIVAPRPLETPPAIAAPSPAEVAPPPSVDATPASTPPPAPAEPVLETLPALGELLPAERDALPALKMTMHVYNALPESRFVLIDGHRHREGDRLAPSLTLSEIRRDGAVLDFNGRRFLIRRP